MLFEGIEGPFDATGASTSCGMSFGPSWEQLGQFDPGMAPVDVALARIRQLSAHEVGHTLGFSHNFAASANDRASVMDYPAPLAKLNEVGEFDLSDAYAVGIGEWDKVAVRFAYSDFSESVKEEEALDSILSESIRRGLLYVTDSDARPPGAAHPLASLWDNGADPVSALEHTMRVRRAALERFGEGNIAVGQPLSELTRVLVPLYLHHRYQVEATAKLMGGVFYGYKVRGDDMPLQEIASPSQQREALRAVLSTVSPTELTLEPELLRLLQPVAFGYSDRRERFSGRTDPAFDPLSAAETAAGISLAAVLQSERSGRLVLFHSENPDNPGLEEVIDAVLAVTWKRDPETDALGQTVARVVQDVALTLLLGLASDPDALADVRAVAVSKLVSLKDYLKARSPANELEEAHGTQAIARIERFLDRPHAVDGPLKSLRVPPGSPIGNPGIN
jgi:hypothetical protein